MAEKEPENAVHFNKDPPTAATPAAPLTASLTASAVPAAAQQQTNEPAATVGNTATAKPFSPRATRSKSQHHMKSIPEDDSRSQGSSHIRNSLQMQDSKNNLQSIEVMVEENFHRCFDSDTLNVYKNPDFTKKVRFDETSLSAIEEDKLTAEDRSKLSALRSFDEIKKMMNTKFSFQEGRLSSTLDVLAQYMRGQKILYLEAKSYCEFYLYRLMIPTIFISTVCSVISGIFSDLAFASMAVAAASGLNTLLLALINYFKLDARAEAHRMTAYSFDQLISECEFTSGKILLSNLVKTNTVDEDAEIYDLKYIQNFISLIENKVKEIKQKNQFIIPDTIRHSFPNIYYTNVFALVTQSQIQEMIIINQLKLACNAFTEVENQIIKGDRRDEIYLDYNEKLRQKNNLIERILEHRTNLLAFDQVLRREVRKNKKWCLWLRCCY